MCGSSSIVLVGSLLTFDKSKYDNDFVRLFPPHAADVRTTYQIPSGSNLIALTSEAVILQNRYGLVRVDIHSGDTTRIQLKIPFGAEVLIDSPYFFIHQGSLGEIRRGPIKKWQTDTIISFPHGFTGLQSISGNRLILRTMDISERKNYLSNLERTTTFTLKKQVDGLLCTDGILLYSDELNWLVYIFRYRNQFICLDANLDIVRLGNTIDTTSVAKISVAEVGGNITMSKPPLAVNTNARVSGKYLFVQSNLMAKNESQEDIKERTVIDVYNLFDSSYAFSFYVQDESGSSMESFIVNDLTLAAVFKNTLVLYDLPSKYLP